MSTDPNNPQGPATPNRRGRLTKSRAIAAGASVGALVLVTAGIAAANPAKDSSGGAKAAPGNGTDANRSNPGTTGPGDDSGWFDGGQSSGSGQGVDGDGDGRIGDPGDGSSSDNGGSSSDSGGFQQAPSDGFQQAPSGGFQQAPSGSFQAPQPGGTFDPGFGGGGGHSSSGGS